MSLLFSLIAHFLVTLARLARPGGLGAVAAESLAVKHQLLILRRVRRTRRSLKRTHRRRCRDKRRNRRFGCRKIAEQISSAFGLEINKDVVRRILIQHYKPIPGGDDGPSWLSVIGHAKDSLLSVDLFRCESILLKSYWVMVGRVTL